MKTKTKSLNLPTAKQLKARRKRLKNALANFVKTQVTFGDLHKTFTITRTESGLEIHN